MAKLLAFLPCEKAIIANDNVVTLIALVETITMNVQAKDVPPNSGVPFPWNIFVMWRKEPVDEGHRYQQRCELVAPGDKVVLTIPPVDFQMITSTHRVTAGVVGFPIAGEGEYTLKLWLRRDEGTWAEVARYPIAVQYRPLDA